MRKTKIIATVGPACKEVETLKRLIEQGVNVFRINTSHTTPDDLRHWIRTLRKASADATSPVSILVDLQGPRIRTGPLANFESLDLKVGESYYIVPANRPGGGHVITTSCVEFPKMVKPGDRILLDNGRLELCVLRKEQKDTLCGVIRGGILGENKGINLPNAPVTLPALTEMDEDQLALALEHRVEYVALSFVRSEKDIATVRNVIRRLKGEVQVIAKIEKPKAVECLDRIIKVSDGLMVARGDLGIEMGIEKVPGVQKQIIERSNQCGVWVITATQMLESMMDRPSPLRAEVSDIANAVLDGTDAVMLSGETSIGSYPLETVEMMVRIIEEAENYQASQFIRTAN